jgi:hypothetical protein
MANETTRSRLRADVPEKLIRAARVRAGLEGTDVNVVIGQALEKFLTEELAILNQREVQNQQQK